MSMTKRVRLTPHERQIERELLQGLTVERARAEIKRLSQLRRDVNDLKRKSRQLDLLTRPDPGSRSQDN